MTKIKPAEVRAAAKKVRAALALSVAMLDARDVVAAYAAAEEAQHLAYDMKMLIGDALEVTS